MATPAAMPPNAPRINVLTVGFLSDGKILLHLVAIAIRKPIEVFGISSVVVICSSGLMPTICDTLFKLKVITMHPQIVTANRTQRQPCGVCST
jgi:hypothetical protein